jgi:hypothetical protein
MAKNELTKPINTAVTTWEEELAAAAQEESKNEKVNNNYFSINNAKISFMGSDLGSEMDVVILDALHDRAMYPGSFGQAKSPICFSYSKDGIGMVPHDASQEKQSETCEGCQWNKFGSAQQGEGKACREYRRLAVISARELESEEVPEAILGILKVPPTSMRNYSDYVRALANVSKRPVWSVATTITVTADVKKKFILSFKPSANLSQEVVAAVQSRLPSAAEANATPYPTIIMETAQPKAATRAKFGVGKAKA